MEFRDALKLLRSELGLTQSELAAALHVNYATVGRWETGKTLPTQSIAAVLMDFARSSSASKACLDRLGQSVRSASRKKLPISRDALYSVEHASLRQLIDNASFPIYVCDMETDELLYVNDKAKQLIGCRIDELPGCKCYQCFMHRDAPCEFCHKNELVEDRFIMHNTSYFYDGISYQVQGKLIQWNGRRAQVRYITQTDADKHLKAIVEKMSGGVSASSVNSNGEARLSYANDHFYKMLGYTREQFKQEVPNPFSTIFCDDITAMHQEILDAQSTGEAKSFQHRAVCRDGRIIWLKIDAVSISFDDINTPVILSVFTDVTAMVEATKQLEAQHEQISRLLNDTPGGIAIIEGDVSNGIAEMHTIYYNDSFIAFSGYTREEYDAHLCKNVLSLVFSESIPAFDSLVKALSEGEIGSKQSCTIRCRTKSGDFRWLLLTGQLSQKQGEHCVINLVQMDITLRKEAEDKLRIREEMLRIAADADQRIVVTYDITTNICRMESRKLSFVHSGETIGNVPESLVHTGIVAQESAAELYDLFEHIHKGEQTALATLQLRMSSENDYEWFECSATTLFSEAGQPNQAVLMLRNITDQRIKKAMFLKWQQITNNRPASTYSLFRCNLSRNGHLDIRSGELLKIIFSPKSTSFAARTKEYVSLYVYPDDREAYSALMNTDVLLSMFYRGVCTAALDYREMDDDGASAWRRLSLEMVDHPYSGDVHIFLMYEDINDEKTAELLEKERTETDLLTGILTRTAFQNKVVEVIKREVNTQHALLLLDIDDLNRLNDSHGQAAGDQVLKRVAVMLRSLIREGDVVCRLGGDEFLVWLHDIPYDAVIEKKAQQLCDQIRKSLSPDAQVSASIGISVYPRDALDFDDLFEKANSALKAVKRSGKNSYAFFSASSGAEDKATPSAEDMPEPMDLMNKRRMLIVDDNAISRAILDDLFKNEFLIETAKNGIDALLCLRHFGSSISVVLLDLFMPGMNGYEVLAQMQSDEEFRTIPVIVVSGSDEHETALKAIEMGASDFVIKPVDVDLIRIRVKSAISKAENEHLRAQNSYLQLQRDEELKYRTVLESTGTVVVEYNWRSHFFIYDNTISRYIAGDYNNRSLWSVFLTDQVADKADVEALQEMLMRLVGDKNQREASRLVMLKTPGGEKHWFRMSVYKQVDVSGHASKMIIALNDVHDEVLANEKLRFQVTRDELTGLYNRTGFIEKAAELIATHAPGYYVLSCIDIEKFKVINDQYGTQKGDDVLRRFGVMLKRLHSNEGGICCRVMADNFAVLYPASLIGTKDLANSHDAVKQLDSSIPPIKIAVGRCIVDDKTLDVSAIYDRAILAKDSVKDRYDVYIATYDESMRVKLLRQQEITSQMRQALESGQFEAWLQPQFNHATGKLSGAEALVRWRHPVEGIISPVEFIPIFERNGFVYEVDKFVWEQTCKYLRKWLDMGLKPVPVSVNISRYDVFRSDIIDVITGLVAKYQLPNDLLRLEITESAFSDNAEQIIHVVEQLVEKGFVVEIDDFGSGYSSLNTLKDVPAQVLKMDMRFIERGKNSDRGGSIVESVVRMAKWLDMSVIAEGVETIEQADYLKSIGCNYIQGYLYSKPQQLPDYERFLTDESVQSVVSNLQALETWNNNAFWDPKSMESLIFNSYVGGAYIFEYANGRAELLRYNDGFMNMFMSNINYNHEAARHNLLPLLSDENRVAFEKTINTVIETKKEASCEIYLANNDGTPMYLRTAMRQIASTGKRSLIYVSVTDITEQREAERGQLASARRLEAIMDHMDGGVAASVVRDGRVHYLFANRRYYELMGYTKEEYEGQFTGSFNAIHPDDREKTNAVIRQAAVDLKPYRVEFRLIRKDKSICWLSCNAIIVQFPDQNEPVHLVTINDTTAMREAQQKEHNLTTQLQAIMSNVRGGIVATRFHDRDYAEVVFANDGYYEMYGFTRASMAAEVPNVLDVVLPEDRECVIKHMSEILKTRGGATYEYRCQKRDGSIVWTRTTSSVMAIEGIGDNVLLGITFDITDLHLAQQAAHDTAEKLKAVLDSADDGISAAIQRGDEIDVILVNKKFYELLNISQQDFLHQSMVQTMGYVHPDDRKHVLSMIRTTQVGQQSQTEYRVIHPDGSLHWIKARMSVTRFSGIDEPVQVTVFSDTTAEKEAEEQFRFLNETAHRILAQPDSEKAVLDTLYDLATYFSASAGYVFEINYDDMCLQSTYEVTAGGARSGLRDQSIPFSQHDSWYASLTHMDSYSIDDISKLEDDSTGIKPLLLERNVRSLYLAPLMRDGVMIGFISLENPQKGMEQMGRLTALSDYIAILLTRRDLQQKIRRNDAELEELPRQLLERFPYGAALYEFDGSMLSPIHINGRYWQLVERPPTSYSNTSVLGSIYPDDVPITVQEIHAAIRQNRNISMDIRIRCGEYGYKPFHIEAAIEPQANGKHRFYTVYSPISDEAISTQDMLSIALQTVMNTTNSISFFKDRNSRYVCGSKQLLALAGLKSMSELVGKCADDIYLPDAAAKCNATDKRIIEHGHALVDYEELFPSGNGTRRLQLSKYPMLDSHGNILGIFGTGRDITAARIAQSRLEALTNSIPGGIAVYEIDRAAPNGIRLGYFSDGLCRIFGYSREAYEKKAVVNPFSLVSQDDASRLREAIRCLANGGEPVDYTCRVTVNNGEIKWINVKAALGEPESDKLIVNAIFFDATEQKHVEEQLRISAEEFKLAAQHSDTTICRYNVAQRSLTFTAGDAKRLEIPEVMENVPYSILEAGRISPETSQAYLAFYESILDGKEECAVTFRKHMSIGWRWMSAHATTMFSDAGAPTTAIISYVDVTDQLEKEAIYKRWQQRLEVKGPESYTLMRCNMNENRAYDRIEGTLLSFTPSGDEKQCFDDHTRDFVRQCVSPEDHEKYTNIIEYNKIITNFYRGKRALQLDFRGKISTGETHWLRLSVELVEYPDTTAIAAYLMYEDINEEKNKALQTKMKAETDSLTGLLNRDTFIELLTKSIMHGHEKGLYALLLIDVDGFKLVNDTYGHIVGDQVLIDTGRAIRAELRECDLVGRLGGDEYLICLSSMPNRESILKRARRICDVVQESSNNDIRTSISMGISVYPEDGMTFERLYHMADKALYFVKEHGKDNCAFYDVSMEG